MVHFYGRCSFISGIILGAFLGLVIKQVAIKWESKKPQPLGEKYEKWFQKQGVKRYHNPWHTLESLQKNYLSESQYLFRKIKVLCVITRKEEANLNASLSTWAMGCNQVQSIVLHKNKSPLPSMKIVKENSSWSQLCGVLREVNLNKTDWIFVANEYTFAILENFRYYVAALDSQKAHYLGHAVKFWSTVYNTKASAYALNRNAIKIFQEHVKKTDCIAEKAYLNKEDFYLGKTLQYLNVTPMDTRDAEGFSIFYPNTWEQVLFSGAENDQSSSVYPVNCCSKMSVAFQTNNNNKMFTFFYLLYNLKVIFNRDLENEYQASHTKFDEHEDNLVWKNFLESQEISFENVSSKQYFKIWEKVIADPKSPWYITPKDHKPPDYGDNNN